MSTIDPSQSYDIVQTLTFASGSGTCNIRLYRGTGSTYSGTVYYRAGTSGSWTSLSVSGGSTTFPVSSTTMQVAHDWNKSGDDYMASSFYGQTTNLTGIAISQKAVLSGAIGNYFMYFYAYNCPALTTLDVPDTSSVTSLGTYFMYYYAYLCSALTTIGVPDTSSVTSLGTYFMYSYARGCTSLITLGAPNIPAVTSVGTNFMYNYAYDCTSLTTLGAPDVSSVTSVTYFFMAYYAYGCSALTTIGVPDVSSVTSVGDYFMLSYARNCTSLTTLAVPDTSSLTSVGTNFMFNYAFSCSALTTLNLPAAGWFASHNVDWSVPIGRLTYLKGYVTNSTDLTNWQALTSSGNTLYTNYIRSSGDVILSGTTNKGFFF